ncbi:4a-hydroxytetrahydrobiopterin dehydratase [Parasalinivibrio latis]|uniref:4a-hydroxytetrahydrobiopterin dehydratase n=1 Tax=Parasalinivibrio latis TaxID=2952610 RepID=UPI0030DF8372
MTEVTLKELTGQKCKACSADAPRVTDGELASLMLTLPEWDLDKQSGISQLTRSYEFRNFKLAWAFSNKVAELAEEEGHHPAILLEWGKVKVSWWTHAIGGLHKNDFICAAKTDALIKS